MNRTLIMEAAIQDAVKTIEGDSLAYWKGAADAPSTPKRQWMQRSLGRDPCSDEWELYCNTYRAGMARGVRYIHRNYKPEWHTADVHLHIDDVSAGAEAAAWEGEEN